MKRLTVCLAIPALFLATIAACGVVGGNPAPEPLAVTSQPLTAAGSVPAGLPQRVLVSLKEGHLSSWMTNSGVAWDARYRYFTKGWVNNWNPNGPSDGSWGLQYLQQCDTQGYIPVVQHYQVNDEKVNGLYANDETKFLLKVQNATTMAGYFADFKVLMQKVKAFNKPVVILLEADGFAFLEKQSNDNPNAYAAVADTGMAELSGLPNTVAGWGLAFLQLRKSVGATNAILGIHVSAWASGNAIAYTSPSIPLQPEVDKVYDFLAPLGLASNITGETYDLLVGDPLDRDSDYYKLVKNQDRSWCYRASWMREKWARVRAQNDGEAHGRGQDSISKPGEGRRRGRVVGRGPPPRVRVRPRQHS